jgi:hypothetical protein
LTAVASNPTVLTALLQARNAWFGLSDKTINRNMVSRRAGPVLAIRQNKHEASPADWAELRKVLASYREELERQKFVVYTDGGTLTAPQRKDLAELLGDAHALVAVVSDSMKVRFAGATISLFQKNYRQFTTNELHEAYAHLGLTPADQRQVQHVLKELEEIVYPDGKPLK